MSWLNRRRPKKTHPWPPNDRRYLPQALEPVTRILERWAREGREFGGRQMTIEPLNCGPVPDGFTYAGSGR